LSYIEIDHVSVDEATEVVLADEVNDLMDIVFVVFDEVVVDFVEVVLAVDDLLEVFFVVAALAASALQLDKHSEELQYAEVVPHEP